MTLLLVADDSNFARRLLIDRLPDDPKLDVIEAADGAETIALYEARKPDVVLLDLNMPTDGYEVLARLLALDAGARVIVVTADSQHGAFERVRAAGARGFLTKPVDPVLLAAALREVLAM